MNKKEMDMLENVFDAEINGMLYRTSSKIAKKLEEEGYIEMDEKVICQDRFGIVKSNGFRTTLKGNIEYCMSERCSGELIE